MVVYRKMFTKDEQKTAADQKTDDQNTDYSLVDVLLGKHVKIARKEKRLPPFVLRRQNKCYVLQMKLWKI